MAESEYKVYGESPDKSVKKSYWDAAKGLQRVDGLTPTQYLSELAEANIEGELSYDEVEGLLYKRYEDETPEDIKNRNKEADLVAARIAHILDSPGYPLQIASLKAIHRELFKDIYDHAGQFRKVNIYKQEPILNGATVKYTNYTALDDTLEYDFNAEKNKSYSGFTQEQIIKRIAAFTSSIWQAHPFMEGNTRTTAVFMECYLNNMGFQADNKMFKDYSQYFRNALVRANYAAYAKGIVETNEFLEKFYKNLLTGGDDKLTKRELILKECFLQKDIEREI
ncbi:Fic family protein [Clostridium sp. Marseille-P2415]|uniref:Fic family protein n=1 Tax=Clostridium sp. Marseille-P2415 TaxID=1805471 RepID=UPI00098877B9|nr:Fic family protein [Clostridium sp. Marseille-P2415]